MHYGAFPTCRYANGGAVILVKTQDELDALAPGIWFDSPAAVTPSVTVYTEDEPTETTIPIAQESEPEPAPIKRGPGRPRKIKE